MKKVSLSGSPRANVGKKDAKAQRREGMVPCVVYGTGEQTFFTVDEVNIKKVVYTPEVFQYELDIDGKKVNAVIQDLQFHPVSDKVTHVDFLEIVPGKDVKISVPLRMTGQSPGVRAGGRLAVQYRTIKAKGAADKFPEAIEVDISAMEIGDKIRVSELAWEGLTFLAAPTDVLVSVKTSRAAMSAEAEDEEGEAAEGEAAEGGEAAEAKTEG